MVKYLDSSESDPERALSNWIAANLVAGLRSFRCQSGFFSLASLRDHLATLRSVGTIRLVLGSNAPEQPTAEDVRALLPLLEDPSSRSLTIVRCGGNALFHPKTLHMVREDGSPVGYVGSANMTGAGLGLNVEAGVILGPESAVALDDMASSIDAWASRSEDGVFQVHSEADVDALTEQGVLVTAAVKRTSRAAGRAAHGERGHGRGLPRARLWKPAAVHGEHRRGERSTADALAEGAPPDAELTVVHHRWCKELRRSDAQQVRADTNPTGKLRLAKAKFAIEHQTYFREVFFGGESWAGVERRKTLYEECSVPFHCTVHGVDLGEQVLRIDHAPHRVAKQNNVPTVLSWGPKLGRHLRENSEVGNWVLLERHEDGAFSLTITDDQPDWAP